MRSLTSGSRCAVGNSRKAGTKRRNVLPAAVEMLEVRCLLASAPNLLSNATVEAGSGGAPTDWTWTGSANPDWTEAQLSDYYTNHNLKFNMGRADHAWVQDSAVAFTGTGALSLTSIAPNRPDLIINTWYGMQPVDGYWLSKSMTCTAGTSYVASAWLKRNVAREDTPWYGPLEIRFYNSNGTQLAVSNVRSGIFNKMPADMWTYGQTMPYVAPTGAVTMKLRFGQEFQANTGGDGITIADNLAVWALPASLPVSVRRPDSNYLMANVPNFIHWFRDATATLQQPSFSSPSDTTSFLNTWDTVENAVTGNLYYDKNASSPVSILVTNLLGNTRNLSLRVTRYNWLGVAGAPINIPVQAVPGYSTSTFSAALPATGSYGAYYLDVQVLEGASTVGTTSGRYAVMPPLTRPETVKNIWGVSSMAGYAPTTVLSDVFAGANGTSLTLSGNAGDTKTGNYTPTGDTITYSATHQGSTAFNVSLTGKQNAVNAQAGLSLTNNSGQTITATKGEVYTTVNVAQKMGWTAGSITANQVATLVLGFDYQASGFADGVTAGLDVSNGGALVDGLTHFFASTSLPAATGQNHKAVFLSNLPDASIQVIADFLNANGGNLRILFSYSGNLNAGAALSVADILLTSTSLQSQDLGKMMQTAGFGLAWVRLMDYCDDFANAAAIANARAQVEWYRNLGIRSVLQIYGSSTYTSPLTSARQQAQYDAGRTIASQFKDIVVAIGDWGIEQSNHRTPADPVYRPYDQNGVMMDDATYDTIMLNLHNGLKSVAPNLPVLIGNIATANPDAFYADTMFRMYGSPVNGNFDGAILNVYYNEVGMPNVTLEAMDRNGDTNRTIWIEENANTDVPVGPTGEDAGANEMVMWRSTQAAKYYGRIEGITQWLFADASSGLHLQRDMLNQAQQPRPHYVAQAVMADALADATFVGDHSINNSSVNWWDYPTFGMYEWQRSDGPMWIAFAYGSSGNQTFNVTNSSVTTMDLMGNRTVIPAVNGKVTINLTKSPIYIFDGGTISNGIPGMPMNPLATAQNGSVKLTWDAVPNATGYKVYRGTYWSGKTTTAYDPIATVTGGATTTFIDTGRTPGTMYYYRITALQGTAESGKSNEKSIAPAATGDIYLQASDVINTSSFTATTNWSDKLLPHSDSDYLNIPWAGSTNYFSVRTPSGGGNYTFNGASLRLLGSAGGGSLHLKGLAGESETININNLYLQNGANIVTDEANINYTINGSWIINDGTAPQVSPVKAGYTLTINSTLSGTGPLNFAYGNANVGTIAIGSTNNTLSGLITISAVPMTVAGDLSLGTGNIQMSSAAKLTLSGGAANNYIADTANLSVANGCTVNLNFTGVDRLGSITLNGVNYTTGTFGAPGSGAINTSNFFTGTGVLAVGAWPPAPAAVSMQVNDGSIQRSKVKSLTLTFDQSVALPPGALVLTRRGGTNGITTIITPASGLNNTYTVTFGNTGNSDGSLPDGAYTLTLNASAIKDGYLQSLTGGNRTFTFHALFGDINGDRVVDATDAAAFKSAMNKPVGSLWYMNYNNDLIIDKTDYLQMRSRMIKPLL